MCVCGLDLHTTLKKEELQSLALTAMTDLFSVPGAGEAYFVLDHIVLLFMPLNRGGTG